jgi:UDP-N-acetylmuramate dehydrogenase
MPEMKKSSWIEDADVRGRVTFGTPLSDLTWFRVGGPADILFRPEDEDDLVSFLKACPADVPVTVIGVGSNLLVRDGGIEGAVVKLGRSFAKVAVEGHKVRAGAAASDVNVALACRDAGLAGLEFLRGIPGTIGGAVRMNAGAYGREISDVLETARAIDREGQAHDVVAHDLKLTYRHNKAPADWIFTSVVLRGVAGDKEAIAAAMREISTAREETQPIKTRTGGSTFKNPTDPQAKGRKAWQLIDAAGCRGLTRGGAQVSPMHCNFLINTGNATAADLEGLGEEVRRRVEAETGVVLDWEIRIVGRHKKSGGAS